MSFSLCIAFTYCTDDLVQGNEEGKYREDRDPRTNFSVREGTLRMIHFYFQAQEDDINSKKTTRRPSVRSRRSTVHAKKESILFETFQPAGNHGLSMSHILPSRINV